MTNANCTSCYGTGEQVTEQGPITCPDCFGDGHALSHGSKLEWRLREIERLHRGSGQDSEADILWLVHEVRRSRDALLLILARCQDADEADPLAQFVKFQANEALGLYNPK